MNNNIGKFAPDEFGWQPMLDAEDEMYQEPGPPIWNPDEPIGPAVKYFDPPILPPAPGNEDVKVVQNDDGGMTAELKEPLPPIQAPKNKALLIAGALVLAYLIFKK